MDTKRNPVFHAGSGATIVDLAKYKRGLKTATRKPRKKKVPKYEIIVCDCGGSDFKFVLASDVEHLRNSIVCACCAQPVADEAILRGVAGMVSHLL